MPDVDLIPYDLATAPPDGPGQMLRALTEIRKRLVWAYADLDALVVVSATEWESRIVHVDELNANFQAMDGTWVQITEARFASTGARDSAYAKASAAYRINGVLSRDTATNITYRHNGSAWKVWTAPETAYTPALSGLTVGTTGTLDYAYYRVSEGMASIDFSYTLGGTGIVVGDVIIGLPSALPTASWFPDVAPMGIGELLDASAGPSRYASFLIRNPSGMRFMSLGTASVFLALSSTVPFTWATTDKLFGHATYPV